MSRRQNNSEFEENEAALYKNRKETNKYEGNPPNIKEFEDIWAVSGKQKDKSIEKLGG